MQIVNNSKFLVDKIPAQTHCHLAIVIKHITIDLVFIYVLGKQLADNVKDLGRVAVIGKATCVCHHAAIDGDSTSFCHLLEAAKLADDTKDHL